MTKRRKRKKRKKTAAMKRIVRVELWRKSLQLTLIGMVRDVGRSVW